MEEETLKPMEPNVPSDGPLEQQETENIEKPEQVTEKDAQKRMLKEGEERSMMTYDLYKGKITMLDGKKDIQSNGMSAFDNYALSRLSGVEKQLKEFTARDLGISGYCIRLVLGSPVKYPKRTSRNDLVYNKFFIFFKLLNS